MKEIEAKVATVLDSERVALNVGSDEGVAEGDAVTLWRLVEIADPDTSEILGEARLDKLKMVVDTAGERFSIASIRQGRSPGVALWGSSNLKKIGSGTRDTNVDVNEGDPATVYLTKRE